MSLTDQSIKLDLIQSTQSIKTKKLDGKTQIWDPIRRKYLVLQPEELVRQSVIQYLIDIGFSIKMINVEKEIQVGNQKKRYDIVVYLKASTPMLLVECKKPDTLIDQKSFDQISNYNIALQIPYLLVTNGHKSYLSFIDFTQKKYTFMTDEKVIKNIAMNELKWNYSEFLTFVLIHAAYADLELTKDEQDTIVNRFGKGMFDKILKQYEEMGEYDRLEEIMKYKGVYYPTVERKQIILDEMRKIFEADGVYSKLEVNLKEFLERLL